MTIRLTMDLEVQVAGERLGLPSELFRKQHRALRPKLQQLAWGLQLSFDTH